MVRSLVVIVGVVMSVCGVMAVHLVRRDVDPLRDVMSHYSNGSRGPPMSVVFRFGSLVLLSLGTACVVVLHALRRDLTPAAHRIMARSFESIRQDSS